MALLIGLMRLSRDAELRYTPDGTAVASLSLAYNWGKKNSDGKRATTWIEGALWGDRASGLAEYLLKGTAIVATLEDLHTEDFQRRDGSPGYKLVAKVLQLEFAGSSNSEPRAPAPAPAPRPTAAPRPAPAPKSSTGFDDMDEDIPF